jgi:hypothetical protein
MTRDWVTERYGAWRVQYDPEAACFSEVAAALREPGSLIKRSRKAEVRSFEGWIAKISRDPLGVGWLKYTALRGYYRRGWRAANYLYTHGVLTPRPIAYAERGVCGVLNGNAMVVERLEAHRNVEDWMRDLVRSGVDRARIQHFLDGLADAVNGLSAAGAYHADLSGKNIFTDDGERFWFIDMDAVFLNADYDDKKRLKNAVQLYDSFCDALSDTLLVPFMGRVLGPDRDLRTWMPEIRLAQRERRARTERKTRRSRGKTSSR